MATFISRRLIHALVVVIIVSLMVFISIRLLPGDPILLFLSEGQVEALTEEQIQAARAQFGLDKSMITQYFEWVFNLFHGNFGMSIFYQQKVSDLIVSRIPITFHISILAFVSSGILGLVAGVVAGLRRGKPVDTMVTTLSVMGICIPAFWLAILLIYFFGLRLSWLPIYGYTSPFEDFWLNTKQLVLPVFCMGIHGLAGEARQTRSSILEVVRQDYIRTAWSKGLSERLVVIRHVLKNGLIPVVTLKGMGLGHILGGSVIIETIFNIPGMGRLSVSALQSHDYQVVQACVLLAAVTVVLSNLLVDITYGWLDPRVRYA
jgi:peptide/nickel transport system permease protein